MERQTTPRVLFVSGSIGLGHAARDLAIAGELRRLLPSAQLEWLAGDPARRLIEQAGEALLAESSELSDETATAEQSAEGASLNIIRYLLRARGAWKQTVRTFEQVTASHPYDLVVGDETYEIAVALHRRPELKRAPFTLIYDFVGMDAMTRNPAERAMVYVWNRIWCGGPRGRRPPVDQVLFIGEPEDIPDRPFGYRLPNRREYASRHYQFVGYVLGFDPAAYSDRAKLRAKLGYSERPLIVCSVGGTSVGAELLERCAAAFPLIERHVPEARMVLVCGPRIDPASIRAPSGVEVLGYVHRLHEHLAACDLAIVQGGGTTTLELTALRRPFI
jgi:UDP:flavonoid glycosyltransferase YjiC (YdhE family)